MADEKLWRDLLSRENSDDNFVGIRASNPFPRFRIPRGLSSLDKDDEPGYWEAHSNCEIHHMRTEYRYERRTNPVSHSINDGVRRSPRFQKTRIKYAKRI